MVFWPQNGGVGWFVLTELWPSWVDERFASSVWVCWRPFGGLQICHSSACYVLGKSLPRFLGSRNLESILRKKTWNLLPFALGTPTLWCNIATTLLSGHCLMDLLMVSDIFLIRNPKKIEKQTLKILLKKWWFTRSFCGILWYVDFTPKRHENGKPHEAAGSIFLGASLAELQTWSTLKTALHSLPWAITTKTCQDNYCQWVIHQKTGWVAELTERDAIWT